MGKFSVPPLPILLLVASVGCSQPGSTPGPSATGSVATPAVSTSPSAVTPSDAPPSPSGSVPASAPPSAAAVRVEFLEAVGTKRWGDTPFTVKAEADNGAALAFAATGDCAVDKASGQVEIEGAGSCTITAQTATGDPASASLTFKIARAKPKITFGDKTVRWTRDLAFSPGAKVTPKIGLTYTLVAAGSGDDCRIVDQKLTLDGRQPSLRADCRVRVAAAKTSPDYDPPKPVTATIHVDFPAWEVDATSPDTVDFGDDGEEVTVVVRENTGDALGITVEQTGNADEGICGPIRTTPTNPPPGTTTYTIVLQVSQPQTTSGYICHMTAKAEPPDYFDPGGTSSDDFTVTVVP